MVIHSPVSYNGIDSIAECFSISVERVMAVYELEVISTVLHGKLWHIK